MIVTLPVQCDLGEAGSLYRSQHRVGARAPQAAFRKPVPFTNGALLPLRGEFHSIVFTGKRAAGGVVRAQATKALPELRVSGRVEHAPRRLRDWLADEARRDLDTRVLVHARSLGVKAKRIAIRDQATRWGSCSTTGVLSFSWRLILAPSRILDYVAAHEVAHLAEMNHGPRFWAHVERLLPSMKDDKRWLQVYGLDLHRYGPCEQHAD